MPFGAVKETVAERPDDRNVAAGSEAWAGMAQGAGIFAVFAAKKCPAVCEAEGEGGYDKATGHCTGGKQQRCYYSHFDAKWKLREGY